MKYVVLAGRILYSAIFLVSAPGHFTKKLISFAAGKGVPFAHFAVPLAGVISFLGALSVLLGYKAKAGAWLLVVFLVPVTLMIHNFWAVSNPAQAQLQYVNFMKNISMLGAALMIAHYGSGPLSIDRI